MNAHVTPLLTGVICHISVWMEHLSGHLVGGWGGGGRGVTVLCVWKGNDRNELQQLYQSVVFRWFQQNILHNLRGIQEVSRGQQRSAALLSALLHVHLYSADERCAKTDEHDRVQWTNEGNWILLNYSLQSSEKICLHQQKNPKPANSSVEGHLQSLGGGLSVCHWIETNLSARR